MIHEAVRVIREEEPTSLSSIDKTLRGDVETIVAHALEKEKSRRYQAASALGADLRRYLDDEPIAARPASPWYQLRKFARRNRGLAAGVLATFAALVAGLCVSLYAFTQAKFERDEKGKALDTVTMVSDFQGTMLSNIESSRRPSPRSSRPPPSPTPGSRRGTTSGSR